MGEFFKDHDAHCPDAHDFVIGILIVVGGVDEDCDNVFLELVGEAVSAVGGAVELCGSSEFLDVIGIADETRNDEDALCADFRGTTGFAAEDALDLGNIVRDESVCSGRCHRKDVVGVENDGPGDHCVGMGLQAIADGGIKVRQEFDGKRLTKVADNNLAEDADCRCFASDVSPVEQLV